MSKPKYLVRQYAPAYCTGFDLDVIKAVEYDDIIKCHWMERFKHSGFKEFVIKPYDGDELIISAHYKNGEHWVAGFALPENANERLPGGELLRDNWRYKPHKS